MESQQPATHSSNVAEIVAMFLGAVGMKQKALMVPLDLSESQVSRKMKTGVWTVDDIVALAAFFGVAVSDFFEDPEVIRSRMLGKSPLRWIPTPTERDETDIPVTPCEGQLELVEA